MIRIAFTPQTPPLPFLELVADLDGANYTIRLWFNTRATRMLADGAEEAGAWFLTILDEPGETIIAGAVKLVCNWPLFRVLADREPAGYLIAVDTSGAGIDPGLDDLGTRVVLDYITADEVAAAAA